MDNEVLKLDTKATPSQQPVLVDSGALSIDDSLQTPAPDVELSQSTHDISRLPLGIPFLIIILANLKIPNK
ncbi:hypothetical protein [Alteromonas stellipolaris]|uniref:hypothetical protein n=1 Tax=Alteromonas stellipolaris TaxID=233316 RepID=UPI001D32F452|nr:hypothetical protein [Alteromonas stellipolaris]MBZ2164268.1 hypothetical protein [Alteromonas stellipolaris]